MNGMDYIKIFRGDDSDALGYQTIVGTIKTDLDLTGCRAIFRYLGFFQEFDPIPEDGKLTIVIPAQSSRGFPPGVGYASLKVYDPLGKVRTFTNRIPVIVDAMTPMCSCGGSFEVSFSPFPELEPLKIFVGPGADDFDEYTGFLSKIIDRASLEKYGLTILADAMGEDGGSTGKAASPLAVKAAYDAIIKELTDNYYTAQETDEAIDRLAAYYITYNAAGAAFPTRADLINAQTYYSGGAARTPTRNDYAVVLADETHDGAEYRYIYAVADGATTGEWQAQYPVGGVMTIDQSVTKNSANPVSSSGIWSAIWGALASLPTGFSSLYDWCVSQLAGKASTADATLTARYGSTEAAQWTITYPQGWAHGAVYITWFDEFPPIGWVADCDGDRFGPFSDNPNATMLTGEVFGETITATRTALPGYQLGNDDQHILASEAEAEALRAGKLDKAAVIAPSTESSASGKAADAKATGDALTGKLGNTGLQGITNNGALIVAKDAQNTIIIYPGTGGSGNRIVSTYSSSSHGSTTVALALPTADGTLALTSDIPDVSGLASKAANPTAGNLAALDANGNPTDSGKKPADFMAADAKVQLIYNAAGDEATGQAGDMHTSTTLAEKFVVTKNDTSTDFSFLEYGWLGPDIFSGKNTYAYGATRSGANWELVVYCPSTGEIGAAICKNWGITTYVWATIEKDLDPRVAGTVLFGGTWTNCQFGEDNYRDVEFVPRGLQLNPDPTDFLARVSDLAAFSTTKSYAVGDIAGYDGKVYKCTTAHTGAWDASHFTLATKAEVQAYLAGIVASISQKADAADLHYSLVAKTVSGGAVTLDDRAINAVAVSSSLASLTVNFPTATSGKARDFGLRLTVASGITTAPELALPQGVVCENADGEAPEIGADGAATILYFTETASGVFLVKGEVVQTIS